MTDQHRIAEALNEAWDALFDSLPGRWHIGKPWYDARLAAWSVSAWGPQLDPGRAQQSVTGIGESEVAALRNLDARLRGASMPNGDRIEELRRQLRMAYVEGAEAFSRETFDRALTPDELERVLGRYVGR
jgi:hypothetical protein